MKNDNLPEKLATSNAQMEQLRLAWSDFLSEWTKALEPVLEAMERFIEKFDQQNGEK